MTPRSSASRTSASLLLVALVGASFAGCDDSMTEVRVAEVRIQLTTTAFTAIGDAVTATATLHGPRGNEVTGVGVTWSSSDADVATAVGGLITARGNGTAFIRATADEVSDSIQVVVDQVPAAIDVVFPFDTLFALGLRARLEAEIIDANGVEVPSAHLAPTWSTSDEARATIDGDGRLTPLENGAVTVTATVDTLVAERSFQVTSAWDVVIDTSLAEALQWAIEDALPATDTFGVSAAVILADGSEWIGTSGWARPGRRLRPSAQTAPGSIAKAAAGALLLTVIDDGLVDLDDTVGDLLPALPNVTPAATMRQLLNNSSGIANYVAHPSFGSSIAADTSRLWTHTELMESFVATAEFTPGLQYKSSNTGFILGLMVSADFAGDNHRTLMRERIFEPLGLTDAVHLPPWEPSPSDAVPGWWMDGNGTLVDFVPFLSTSLLSSRGIGLMTTSRAMAVFFREFVAGDLLSPSLRAEALTAIPDDGLIPGQIGAGLGLRRYDYLGGRQWGHSGAVSNGSGLVFHDVDLGVTVAVMFNVHPGAHRNTHFSLAPELLRIVRDFTP